ncbi:uncharacterized protein LOC144097290 isoform X2 [Amblyomma americanum]
MNCVIVWGEPGTTRTCVGGLCWILASMPHTATVYASIEDPTLPCATALRTEHDLPEKTATYLVHLKGLNGTEEQFLTYDYSIATPDVPNKATLVVDKDYSNPVIITVLFTDYQTCFVGILPFGDQAEQCMLWVEVEYLERIPQRCNDAFKDSCGSGFLLYSKKLCHF